MENKTSKKERVFSVELKSKRSLRNIALSDGSCDNVLVEGTLGEFVGARFADGIVLEVVGKGGVLRLDLAEDEISKAKAQPISEVKGQ